MSDRNTNARFELAPQAEIERSTFHRPCNIKTSANVGDLFVFYLDEVLPGDTFEIQTSKVARLQTLLTPVMDNLYLDTYYFFVPNRLVWEHWQEFCGENKTSAWIPNVEYTIPQIIEPSGGWTTGTIADYMNVPIGVDNGMSISALPFRAYALIVNEWFRDENLQQPLNIPRGDATVQGVNTDNYVTDCAKGGKPFVAAKYHDYFTSCLPAPQKGPDVSLLEGLAPIVTEQNVDFSVFPTYLDPDDDPVTYSMKMYKDDGTIAGPNAVISIDSNKDVAAVDAASTLNGDVAVPANLWASLGDTQGMTINYLRRAFAIQRMFERDSLGGSRYIELLKSHFGVESPDARLQRPEYLGGNRVPFNIEQVTQTSSTNATSPLGMQAGWSQTNDVSDDVHKSFTEHGFIIGLMCARYDHSYQQGLERMWTRQSRFDYYWPALAHLGEQAVYMEEIYAKHGGAFRDYVFGYQEAWAEYRYKPNIITGEMRSDYAQSLDIWHFGDDYSGTPYLSASWIQEDKTNVDRTLAVPSSTSNQFFIDIMVNNRVTRPMPLYSVPGLIDHF